MKSGSWGIAASLSAAMGMSGCGTSPAAGTAGLDQAVARQTETLAAAYANRALAREKASDLTGSRADLDRYLELAPGSIPGLLARGQMKVRTNDPDGGIADDTKALGLFPAGQGALPPGADALHALLTDLFPGIVRDHRANAYCLRGMARLSQGDTSGSLNDLSRAIALVPDFSAALRTRGTIKGLYRDEESAKEDFAKAKLSSPR